MKPELEICKILKPRGLKGELKTEALGDASLATPCAVKIGGEQYTLTKFSREGAFIYIMLDEVDTVEKAETLRGKFVCANRALLPPLADGEYYIADIIGMSVICDGAVLGEVSDIAQYGAADVYFVNGTKPFSFPKIDGIVKNIDLKKGEIELDKTLLERTIVYNN